MVLLIEDCIKAHYSARYDLLRYEWLTGADLKLLRPALMAVADIIEEHGLIHCLINCRELPRLGLEDQWWLMHEWLPRVCHPSVKCLAILINQRQYNMMVIENLLKAGQNIIRFDVQFFTEPHEALDWLVAGQEDVVSRLEQEWEQPAQDLNEVTASLLARKASLRR